MYGLAVNLIVSVSGHPWIIDEIVPITIKKQLGNFFIFKFQTSFLSFHSF